MLGKNRNRIIALVLALLLFCNTVPMIVLTAKGNNEFVPENVLSTKLSSAASVQMIVSNGVVENSSRISNDILAALVDGNKEKQNDIYGALDWDPPRYIGALYTLTEPVYCGEAKIFSGTSEYSDTYRVYASESLSSLYSSANMVADDLTCSGDEVSITINKKVKYIAFFCTEYFYGTQRAKEFELWSADEEVDPDAFVSENAFSTKLDSSACVQMFVSNGTVEYGSRITEKNLAALVDGDTETNVNVYGALDWDPPRYIGALYSLKESVYCGEIKIYSGTPEYADTYRVYASDSLSSLYESKNMVADGLKCSGADVSITINKNVKYVAFFCTEYFHGTQRVKEYELWTAQSPDVFVSENLLSKQLSGSKGIAMWPESKEVENNNRFSEATPDALERTVDGKTDSIEVWGALDWGSSARYLGAQYTLKSTYYCEKAVVCSGDTGYPETWLVYASDKLNNLYSQSNLVDTVEVSGNSQEVTINKKVKYISFICTAYDSVMRVREFELWSGQEIATNNGKKVLTIGNSFSENASAYATEIAAAQEYNLTFGYLKMPSATISQHYENIVNNSSIYKFEYTENNGSTNRVTVKDGASTFATIDEALTTMKWDIVVIQQGSTASYDYSTYEKADELIAHIKSKCPDAQIMIHETWSWSTWATDNKPENNFKFIEDCYHKLSADNGNLKIIPTGRAFEFARREGIEVHAADTQHANDFGKYLAGAAYVAAIFGVDITENSYGNQLDTFANVDMSKLRKAVKDAIEFQYNPETNWDYADSEKIPSIKDPNAKNFIKRHYESHIEVLQDVGGGFSEGGRFCEANGDAAKIAIDGDTEKTFQVWGALEWEYPKNIGICYKLDAAYKVEKALIYAGRADHKIIFDVYAADSMGALYQDANKVGSNLACTGNKVEIKVNKEIQYVAFVLTGYPENDNTCNIAEFDLIGSDEPIHIEEIVWPKVPNGKNILEDATAYEMIAPGGDYRGSKEYDFRFMDQKDESDIKYLTDGNISKLYDIWSLTSTDRPGVLYDLGAYYDISHIHAWAGQENSQIICNYGYKVYAADNREDLFKNNNLVYSYSNPKDTTNEMGANIDIKRVRYIAFILTDSTDNGWRMREFAAFGTKSPDQSEPVVQKSIIEGIEPEYYGVATDNLADPIYNGASDSVIALTDGKRDEFEFWGGSDINNTSFVVIYNLYENFDLTGVDIYAFADVIDEETKLHKGIKSAKVYASRKFDQLFTSKPVVVKDGYDNPDLPDENSFYSFEAPNEWKTVKYVAFVFTIGDSRYGACRLEELKVYGKLSAVQDVEEEEAKLPQYIDVKAENGIIARIYSLGGNDDLTKLKVNLFATENKSEKDISFVEKSLANYAVENLYNISLKNSDQQPFNNEGRLIRLSFPEGENKYQVACVDDFGAELVSSNILNGYRTVETETLRNYALVKSTKASSADAVSGQLDILMVIAICLGVISLGGIAATAFMGYKILKKK